MKHTFLPFGQTQAFTLLFLDYINQRPSLTPFYNRFPNLENFGKQIQDKEKSFSIDKRKVLHDTLKRQYEGLTINEKIGFNIDSLLNPKTFTVTTGHQLNIFTGPLYFIFKIVTTINACRKLKQAYPDYTFVPVYWMASEDHDFEEISYFTLNGKKYSWSSPQKGAVGRFGLSGLSDVLKEVPGDTEPFQTAYTQYKTLSAAARYYVNQLFGMEGLLVVDGDDRQLKTSFQQVMMDDIFSEITKPLVSQTKDELEKLGYEAQVYVRDINFFFLDEGLRERIEKQSEGFQINNTSLKFSKEQLQNTILKTPEKLSPNVILRPLYQEMIMPNLAYIGGPAEIVYWLKLKSVFAHYHIPFPILLPRNFALIMDGPLSRKFEKCGVSAEELFLPKQDLLNNFIRRTSDKKLDLNDKTIDFNKFFDQIQLQAEAIDKTLGPLVAAEAHKTIKQLEKIQKKFLQAEKRNQSDKLRQIESVKDALFPNGNLQERTENFLNFFQTNKSFIGYLLETFDPFDFRFNILKYD